MTQPLRSGNGSPADPAAPFGEGAPAPDALLPAVSDPEEPPRPDRAAPADPAVPGDAGTPGSRLVARLCLILAGVTGLWLAMGAIEYAWDWSVVWTYRAVLFSGFVNTIAVSMGAIVLGLVIGLAGGLARVSGSVWLQEAARLYVWVFRGTPLLTQIFIFYFCLAVVVHFDDPFVTGMVVLAFFSGAYITEMVRAGIESISRGQWEAARSTGLTHAQTLRSVIFPQAARRIIPPVTGQFVSLIKDSSLLSVIAVRELTKGAEMVNTATYKTFEAYLPLAVFYLLLTYPLTVLTSRLEKKMIYQSAPKPPNSIITRKGAEQWPRK